MVVRFWCPGQGGDATQEVIRIRRNTSTNLPDRVWIDFLSEFSLRMKMSGWNARFRYEVITCGMAGYQKQVDRAEAGVCPINRPKGYQEEERKKRKQIKKKSWYRPFTSVLFVPPTPVSQLAKEVRKVVEEESKGRKWKIKVIERAGTKLEHQVPGMREDTYCGKEDCFMHTSGGKGDCRKEGVVYRGTCLLCLDKGPSSEVSWDGRVKGVEGERKPGTRSIYWGETSYGAYTRGQQHLAALKKPAKNQNNAFVRHREDCHQNEEGDVKFKFEVVRYYTRAMARQLGEGCYILGPEADILMNGKLDHCQPAVGRVTISTMVTTGRRRNPG